MTWQSFSLFFWELQWLVCTTFCFLLLPHTGICISTASIWTKTDSKTNVVSPFLRLHKRALADLNISWNCQCRKHTDWTQELAWAPTEVRWFKSGTSVLSGDSRSPMWDNVTLTGGSGCSGVTCKLFWQCIQMFNNNMLLSFLAAQKNTMVTKSLV